MATGTGTGEPLTGIASMAMRRVLTELLGTYQASTGQSAVLEAVGGVDAARRVGDGEAFDFVVLAADAIERLEARGRTEPGSRTDLARSGIAIAVATGAAHPDISSEAAVRDAIVRARRIGYSTGPSGDHLTRLLERWGIADAVAARLVRASPGIPVGALVARGDAELGFQQLSELMHLAGADVVGPLPPAIQQATVFAAAICTNARHPGPARSLLAFLASPQADAAKRSQGMDPARA